MAKLRKFVAYRTVERPNTRVSKFRKKSYVRAKPNLKVVRFDMGNVKREYEVALHLLTRSALQIRQEALEAARITSNRLLDKKVGKNNFHLRVRVFPHHILRENPLAAGAGADRFSTGMSHPFGKPIGLAAQLRKGQPVMTLLVNREHIKAGRLALHRAAYKIPCSTLIKEEQLMKAVKQAQVEKKSSTSGSA